MDPSPTARIGGIVPDPAEGQPHLPAEADQPHKYFVLRTRGVSIHRDDCVVVARAGRRQLKGPFWRDDAFRYWASEDQTVLNEGCEGACSEDEARRILVHRGSAAGWPADDALDLAERVSDSPLAALHLVWFAVARTMRELSNFVDERPNQKIAFSPDTLTRPEQRFDRAVEPAVLERLRAVGEAIDGLGLDRAEELRGLLHAALRDGWDFVWAVPELVEALQDGGDDLEPAPDVAPDEEPRSPIGDGVMAMTNDAAQVITLLKRDPEHGAVWRNDGEWLPLLDLGAIAGLAFVGVTDEAIDIYDGFVARNRIVTIGHYPPSPHGPFWPHPVVGYVDGPDDDWDDYDAELEEALGAEFRAAWAGRKGEGPRLELDGLDASGPSEEMRKPMLRAISQRVAALLNSPTGGSLILGHEIAQQVELAAERGKPLGGLLGPFDSWVLSMLDRDFGRQSRTHMYYRLVDDDEGMIDQIDVSPSSHPVLIGDPAELFVREGATVRRLDPRDALDFIHRRWWQPYPEG